MNDERIIFLSQSLIKALRARSRSSNALMNTDAVRVAGKSGGRAATLYANHQRNCELVDKLKQQLKDIL